MPIEIQNTQTSPRTVDVKEKARELLSRERGVTGKERMFFTERLALLLETGSPLHSSLEALQRQAAREPVRHLIGEILQDVTEGHSLSQALGRQPDVFPRTYVSLVSAAEGGGFLPEVLQRLRDMDEKRQELQSTLVTAFSYPAFLILFSFAVIVFVLVVVFPKFSELFSTIMDELPVTTRGLMAVSDFLLRYWAPALAGTATVTLAAWVWAKSSRGGAFLDRLLLALPGLREILIELNVVQFMRVMSLSLTNGVPVLDALRSCREVTRSPTLKNFVASLETRVNEGGNLSTGFQQSRLMPALVAHTITTGEETGRLAMVAGRLADFYERQWRRRLELVSKLVEPVMLLLMGGVVGLIVSSLILPIFKLSKAIH
jgi:type II secretory pathway component PulF